MKTKLTVFIILFIISVCTAQTTAYQVYTLQSINGGRTSDSTVFSNADITVSYSFWDDGGVLTVGIYNKTDKFIYWKLDESFFIKNGNTLDYYNTQTKSTSTTKSLSANMYWLFGIPDVLSRSDAQVITERQQPTTIVPPHAWRVMYGFNLLPYTLGLCSDTAYPIQKFSQTNTPLNITNLISYNVENEPVKRLTHSFYISKAQSYSNEEFVSKQGVEYCDGSLNSANFNPLMAYNRFYVKYTASSSRFCSFGKCNEVSGCSNCCVVGSAYCTLHIKDKLACKNGQCKYLINGLKRCGNCATDSKGYCAVHK